MFLSSQQMPICDELHDQGSEVTKSWYLSLCSRGQLRRRQRLGWRGVGGRYHFTLQAKPHVLSPYPPGYLIPFQQSHLGGAVRSPGRFQVQGGPAIAGGDNQCSISRLWQVFFLSFIFHCFPPLKQLDRAAELPCWWSACTRDLQVPAAHVHPSVQWLVLFGPAHEMRTFFFLPRSDIVIA